MRNGILVTGATGLVGGAVIERLLASDPDLHVHALVRQPAAVAQLAARCGAGMSRVTVLIGDVTLPGLGLDATTRERIRRAVRAVIHTAADTTFSQPLTAARAINTAGTANVLELAATWRVERFVQVSTAYVAGAHTGLVPEREIDDRAGFVNGYEQSKHEAETLVRRCDVPWVILRPSSIVCDDVSGSVSQYNAVHRALRVFHSGLAAMMPGTADTPVDAVTAAYVVDGVISIGLSPAAAGGTFHLCAGTGALALGEALERARARWSADPEWRRRGVCLPALTDLDTYRLFEASVEETGDARLAVITRSLSHFVPQLALPKLFDTRLADAALGRPAPPVTAFWDALVDHLSVTRWGALPAGMSAA